MIDVHTEKLLTLADAARSLPKRGGKKIHPSTLYRWSSNGLRKIRLETVQVGGSRMTSREALTRFFDRLSTIDAPPLVTTELSIQRREAIVTADRQLVDAGILNAEGVKP